MKLSKIGAFCKKKKQILVRQSKTGIYVGDGAAFFRWELTPEVNESLLKGIFDITTDKKDVWFESIDERMASKDDNFRSVGEEDIHAKRLDMKLKLPDALLRPIRYGDSFTLIDDKYLSVFTEDDNYEIYVRENPDFLTVIIVVGMFTLGVIGEYKINPERISDLAAMADILKERGISPTESKPEQEKMDV
jgi:hypothetical protein